MDRACCRRRMPSSKRSTDGYGSTRQNEVQGSSVKRPRGTRSLASEESDGSEPEAEEQSCLGLRPASEMFDGLRRNDLIRVMQQTLLELGLHASRAALEAESGVALESETVTALRKAVLDPSLDEALQISERLSREAPAAGASVRFLILEQKCLELHGNGALEEAQALCRGELAESARNGDKGRVEQIFAQISSQEDRKLESREVLLDRLANLLPKELTVPPKRLSVLLWQALRYQQLQCLHHDIDPCRDGSGASLLEDYSGDSPPLPTSCAARLCRHTDEVWFATVTQNGRFMASASKDNSIVIWEIAADADFRVVQLLVGHAEPCSYLAWSPDDRYMLSASSDCSVRLWAPSSPQPLLMLTKHTESVTAVAWTDNKHFVSAGFDRCIFLWNLEGFALHRWELPCRVQDVAATHDGSRLLVVDSDRNLKVLDVKSRRELPALPESDAVTSVCASRLRDELLVNVAQQVSALQQGPTVRLWDLSSRRIAQRYLGHCQGRFVVRSCFAGPQEEMVVSGSEDAQVYIWHRHYGSLLQVLSGHTSTVNAVCWTLGPLIEGAFAGPWLISAADDGTLRVWGAGLPVTDRDLGEAEERVEQAQDLDETDIGEARDLDEADIGEDPDEADIAEASLGRTSEGSRAEMSQEELEALS